MQHSLPTGLSKFVRPLMISINKTFRTLLLVSGLLIVFSMQAKAQGPEYIQNWTALEEAEFHFDVFYAVVKCNTLSEPSIFLNAFNESGNVDAIGFTLDLKDANGNEARIEIEKFEIGKAEMYKASCESDDYSNLKVQVPSGIDPASVQIEITYNK